MSILDEPGEVGGLQRGGEEGGRAASVPSLVPGAAREAELLPRLPEALASGWRGPG